MLNDSSHARPIRHHSRCRYSPWTLFSKFKIGKLFFIAEKLYWTTKLLSFDERKQRSNAYNDAKLSSKMKKQILVQFPPACVTGISWKQSIHSVRASNSGTGSVRSLQKLYLQIWSNVEFERVFQVETVNIWRIS